MHVLLLVLILHRCLLLLLMSLSSFVHRVCECYDSLLFAFLLSIHIFQVVLKRQWPEIHTDIRGGAGFGLVLFLDDCWRLRQGDGRQMLPLRRWWLPFKRNQCELKRFPTCHQLTSLLLFPSWCNKHLFVCYTCIQCVTLILTDFASHFLGTDISYPRFFYTFGQIISSTQQKQNWFWNLLNDFAVTWLHPSAELLVIF